MNNYRKNRSILQLVMLFVLSLTMAWTMIPGLFGTGAAYAAAGDQPEHAKKLIKNPDGTYTIALSVTGDAEKVKQPVNTNVIVILDTSGSMDENTGNTETTYTPSNQNANNMYGTNDGGQTFFPIYRHTGWGGYYYTTGQSAQSTRYNGQRYLRQVANQTRLEAAQDAINDLAEALLSKNGQDDNPSDLIQMALVTFATTSNTARTPTTSLTQFQTAVNNTNANGGTNWEAGLRTANNINFGDDDQTFVIFVSDGNPTFRTTQNGWNDRYQNGVYGTGQETNQNITRCYTTAVPAAQTLANKVTKDNFFTIGAYGNVDRMESLTTDAGAPAANYFSAENTAALQEALAAILEKIEMAGIADVGISDGTTDEVTVESSTAHLLNVDTSSFKYYRAGGVDEEDNVKYDPDANTATTADGQTLKLGEEWAGAPEATYEDSTVNWDLSDVGVLENKVTYTVTFDCWPSQDTLDYLADIENGLYDELPAAAKEYIDKYGNLDTNTVASLSYKDTRTGETGDVDYTNPDPVTSDAVEQLAVAKEWQNAVDSQSSAPITLDVTRDGTHKYDLTLSSANNWQGNIFISIGMMRTGENGDMEILTTGHDFTFVEPADIGYRWELDIPVVHPMLIDGTLTMLIKVDKDHQPGSAKTYTIGGATYYVGSTGTANLTATNYRRSQLVLTKTVTGENVPSDATFPFTMTVKNSKASEGTASDTHSDKYVWFAIMDSPDARESNIVEDAKYVVSGATAEIGEDGNPTYWYYAESEATISVNIPDGYAVRFINLPKDSEYTFAEGTLAAGFKFDKAELTAGEDDGFEGAQTSTGTVADWNNEYEVTYTNEYVLTDVTVTKVWDDNSNQDGKRPTSLTLTLNGLPEGTEAPTPTVTQSENGNTWTYTWTGLPKYNSAGTAIRYTVTEGTVPTGYEVSGSPAQPGGTITNKHTPELVDVPVQKVWEDAQNQDGIRPNSVTVQLYKYKNSEGEASKTVVSGKTLTLAGTTWEGTFTGLPKYEGGEELVYTVVETPVPDGYSAEVTAGNDGLVVTNTHVPGKVSKTITKVWDDNDDQDGIRPSSVEIVLTGSNNQTYSVNLDGTTDTEPTGTAAAGYESAPWVAAFVNLPEKSSGTAITYTPSETTTTVITGTDAAGTYSFTWGEGKTTVTNKHTPEKTEASVTKVWDDGENQDGKRPASLDVALKNGDTTVETVTLTAQNNWSATVNNLPKYANGQEITYTWDEDTASLPEGYRLDGSTSSGTVTTITNKYTPETTEATVKKVWDDDDDRDGKRPASLDVTLKNGNTTVDTVTLTAQNDWSATVSDLPKNSGGQPITYTWEESSMPEGYSLNGTSKNGTVTTLTNKYDPEKTNVSVTKVWEDGNNQDGKRTDSVQVQLYADGVAYGDPVTLNDENSWSYTWEELFVYPKNEGNASAGDSDTVTTDPQQAAATSEEATSSADTSGNNEAASVEKPADENKPEESKQEEKEEPETGEPAETVDSDTQSAPVSEDLEESVSVDSEPKQAVAEAAKEEPASEEKPTEEIQTEAAEEEPAEITASTKEEDNKITAELVTGEAKAADGDTSGEVSEENAKTKIVYTVEEVEVPEGYEAEVTGEATTGFTITNTHTPETTEAEVKKVWDDNDDAAGKRPAELKVTLSDGTEVTLNEANSWTAKVEDLPKYKAGEEIKYTWSEASMPEGYSLASSETSGTITTLTNKYTAPDKGTVYIDPPVQKIIKGTAPKKAETYTFKLEATNPSNPMPKAAGGSSSMTMNIKGEGIKEFGEIEFTEPGVYAYIVSEIMGDNEDCEYDDTIYTVTATVTEGSDGKLQVVREYKKDGASIDTATFQFVNTYTGSSDGVKTGDESGLAGWLALLLLAGAGTGYIGYNRKRREE